MKRVYLVEWGAESSMGTIADPCQRAFGDLNEALAFYDGIDLRGDWVREHSTSIGTSRHNVIAKRIGDCWAVGGRIEWEQVLRFSEYGEAEYRAEEED